MDPLDPAIQSTAISGVKPLLTLAPEHNDARTIIVDKYVRKGLGKEYCHNLGAFATPSGARITCPPCLEGFHETTTNCR